MSSATQAGEADLSELSRAELEQRVAELEANNSELQQQRDEAVAERDQLRETATELRSELKTRTILPRDPLAGSLNSFHLSVHPALRYANCSMTPSG